MWMDSAEPSHNTLSLCMYIDRPQQELTQRKMTHHQGTVIFSITNDGGICDVKMLCFDFRLPLLRLPKNKANYRLRMLGRSTWVDPIRFYQQVNRNASP